MSYETRVLLLTLPGFVATAMQAWARFAVILSVFAGISVGKTCYLLLPKHDLTSLAGYMIHNVQSSMYDHCNIVTELCPVFLAFVKLRTVEINCQTSFYLHLGHFMPHYPELYPIVFQITL